ncbi:putative disease resistance protein [Vitis vinifera]|uniref:Putative disease resistance protein n=1 Tax=Vitis vinifera TaxID=29760 RepID=A0A438GSM9_VITVI|nr:putative disease resistance protein [Vitis vinifera]
MAESIVTFFLEKLTDLLSQEAFLLSRVEEQVKLLSNELEWMRLFLKDADAKRRYDPRIKLWVSQIRDVTYDAEDVIDRFMFEMNHQQQGSLKCLKFLKLSLFTSSSLESERSTSRLRRLWLTNQGTVFETLPAASSSNEVCHRKRRGFRSLKKSMWWGYVEGAKSVKQMLLNGERRRAVVSIVGMGGLGKTTLAKKVTTIMMSSNTLIVMLGFYVSQEYTIRELLLGIADYVMVLSQKQKSQMNESELGNRLRDYLTTKKRELGPLLKKIFLAGSANAVCPRELEELGKKIVANCGGLPLAIVVLGGLLSRKEKTPLAWQKVLDSLTWHLNQGPDSCLGVLALSYNDMPYYLKSCFLYCGLFPEDSEIRTDKLIRLWVAEGFIQRRGKEIVEDVAEITYRNWGVKLLTVLDLESMDIYTLPEGIGELIHLKYLCLRRTRIERLPSSIGHLINLQTLDFRGTLIEIIPSTIWKLHHLRHLYGHGVVSRQSVIDKCMNGPLGVDHLTALQSLSLRAGSWCSAEGLGKLTQLRELKIRWTEIPQIMCKGFSESVEKLTALRSLYLYTTDGEETLVMPQLMPFLHHTHLYHLELEYCNIEQDPMVTLEKLPNLRILQLLYSSYMGKKMVCSSGGFQRLETLKLKGLKELRELIVEEGQCQI